MGLPGVKVFRPPGWSLTSVRTSYTLPIFFFFSLAFIEINRPRSNPSPRGQRHSHHGWQDAKVPVTARVCTVLGTCVRYRQLADFGARRLPRKAGGDRNRHVSKADPIVTYGGGERRKF